MYVHTFDGIDSRKENEHLLGGGGSGIVHGTHSPHVSTKNCTNVVI